MKRNPTCFFFKSRKCCDVFFWSADSLGLSLEWLLLTFWFASCVVIILVASKRSQNIYQIANCLSLWLWLIIYFHECQTVVSVTFVFLISCRYSSQFFYGIVCLFFTNAFATPRMMQSCILYNMRLPPWFYIGLHTWIGKCPELKMEMPY